MRVFVYWRFLGYPRMNACMLVSGCLFSLDISRFPWFQPQLPIRPKQKTRYVVKPMPCNYDAKPCFTMIQTHCLITQKWFSNIGSATLYHNISK